MSFLIKAIVIAATLFASNATVAGSLCKTGLVGITISAGTSERPESFPPDTEFYRKAGKWPDNLIEQRWHNLRKATHPLWIVCRYAEGDSERVPLSETTDTCVLRPGLVVTCK
jgi:hypothetical protein